ncbi:MAG: hypothetical protein P0Y65_01445 [Candidatus Devosia phytovorans]|uniref:CheA signal transduction histidine kinase n=1 Tax=Candidatus Devosia phytovorans TaxID=3121372 RepID=A0AAJ5VVK0_9HYPH|nr:hypothetical protein [Devosia sp.]WEK04945.1 MAG: hypothetical protein P0Y65_01445 [Devosia sp.]
MADYKELLRRAISALPENNGAARRAVYEKARSALVGQLRAITPPLPARDITQHRLQLEDCIRQVEHEASEAVISLGREGFPTRSATPAPAAPIEPPRPAPVAAAPVEEPQPVELPQAVETQKAVETPRFAAPAEPAPVETASVIEPPADDEPEEPIVAGKSIEEIISEAAESAGAPVKLVKTEDTPSLDAKPDLRAIPSIVARGPSSPLLPPSNVRPIDGLRSPGPEPRRDAAPLAANAMVEPLRTSTRVEPLLGNQATARQQVIAPIAVDVPVEPALSTVREVEVEPDANEAQGVIERAIETLDREARGETTPARPDLPDTSFAAAANAPAGDTFAELPPQRGGAGLTIFLVVFAILLAGAGGAGFWAWREGYVDLDQMFGQAQAPVTDTATPTNNTPTLDPVQSDTTTGPGNTAATPTNEQTDTELNGLQMEDRLEPTPEAVTPAPGQATLPSIETGDDKTEERLPGSTAAATDDPAASVDPADLAGSQSLLLEASQGGATGAVPFSGTVEWSEGVDELGLPTIQGTASIPARNLSVEITLRKNSDPSLPASHLMEVNFNVSDTFIGGSIANLPGVLLKDEELVPGTALVGASARVVGNSFLFALSATQADQTTNTDLLENRRWMDLAVVYGTGRNAIITLEKDDEAQTLFERVFTAWNE